MSTGAIRLQGMASLLQVYDMPQSLHFYRDLLDFTVEQSSGEGDDVDWVSLKHDDAVIMLNTLHEKQHRPAERDLQRQAVHKDVIIYFGCPDVDVTYKQLLERGVAVEEPQVTGYGWKAINLVDPDGYHLCFHWPQ